MGPSWASQCKGAVRPSAKGQPRPRELGWWRRGPGIGEALRRWGLPHVASARDARALALADVWCQWCGVRGILMSDVGASERWD